jgi:Tfp pilus assembly protein PilF
LATLSVITFLPSTKRRRGPRRFIFLIAAFTLATLLAIVFFNYAPRLYRDWRQNRLLDRAASMLQEHKFNEAAQTAREMVKLHPDALPAYYILAEAAEKQNLEETVSWRAQIARLLPQDAESQLNLASAALRFGELDLARKALDRVPAADRDRAAFHVVAGWLARAQGNVAEQEQQFAAAVNKEAGNDLYQFNLAVLQIHSIDAEKSAKARNTLDRLSKMAPFRTGALRALLNDAVERNDLAAADNFAQQLQMSQQVTFGDYLLCLNFYRKLDEKKFRLLLERVKPFAVRNLSDLASLMNWMNENGLAGDVARWIDKLPPEKLSSPRVSIAVADTYATLKNWSRLKRWTSSGSWDESDYLRLGYQAIAARQLRRTTENAEFEALWRSAEQATKALPGRELDLAHLASKWNLPSESEELWLRLAKNPPMRREALDALRRLYRTKNETEKLYEILQRLHESSPKEAPITADLARLGLNLDQNNKQSQDLAKEAYDQAPSEANCAVTYAFALDRLGRNAEGLEIIKKLPSNQLHDPHAAVYVALLLANANQVEAKDYIASTDETKIYVEEKKLLDEARARLAAASSTPSPPVSPSPAELSPTPTSTLSPAPTPAPSLTPARSTS